MLKSITVVDLALHAASTCAVCRTHGRPADESDQEHGDVFTHKSHRFNNGKPEPCGADQIWALIRKLEK